MNSIKTFPTKNLLRFGALSLLAIFPAARLRAADPQLDSWFTTYAGKYARAYTNAAAQNSGNASATWSNGTQVQSLPAYCGVQEVYSSSNYVYIRTTGLGSHVMGAWPNGFPNLPVNSKTFYRIPRSPTVPGTKSANGGGAIGYFVDGVAMFNSWDAFYWNGTSESGGGGSGWWNRDAYVNEGSTFDPGYAHQPQDGTYHYHANPIALRYLLGDHVSYNASTKIYSESTNTPTKHSPILGWVSDGFPIYGPYGYSVSNNAASGIRRMVSGYVLRNGQYGTQNLTAVGRTNLPAWAVRLYGVAATNAGPPVNGTYPLGRYMEDSEFLGDLGVAPGSNTFDLDESNGRWCVTPEFPGGTYAYFVSVSSNGTPVFPYNIGRAFYGSPVGGRVTSLNESVTTNFVGGPNGTFSSNPPVLSNNIVTLVWSSVEGGTYRVESSGDLSSWTTNVSGLTATGVVTGTNLNANGSRSFYRIARTALANYDPVATAGGGNGILSVSPTSGLRGTTFTLTINLDPAVMPPPQMAPILSITVGSIAGTSNVHVSQTQVTSSISIPGGAATGVQTVSVTFPGPPENPSQTVTYTLTGGFSIN